VINTGQTKGRVIGAPTLRGWLSGRPDRETNPVVGVAELLGVRTVPGLYEVIAQQWYRLAKWLKTSRQEIGELSWETTPCGTSPDVPGGDETFDERLWNERLEDLLAGGRVGVETAVPGQIRWGWREWVGLVHDAYWHGFTIAAPYWPSGEASLSSAIAMEVMLRSAVDRFTVGPDLRPEQVWYYTAGGFQRVDYDRVLHVVPQGVTGQLFGEGALRPLIGPGMAWIQSLVQSGIAEIAESGMLVLTGRDGSGDEDFARYDAIMRANDDGQLRGLLLYGEERAERVFPSSSSGARTERLKHLDEMLDVFFSRQNASLYSSGSGSRAASETIGDEDSQVREVTADTLIDLAYRTLAAWVARETGYTGRIRGAVSVQPEARQSPVELVGALSTAATSGLLRWDADDESQLREALGWRIREEEGPQEDAAPTLSVGALTASVEIARALVGSEGVAPLDPAIAREILLGAGLTPEAVDRIVAAAEQSRAQVPAPVEAPAAPVETLDDVLSLASLRLDMADPVPHRHHAGCAHSRISLADSRKVEILGRDGRPFRTWCGLEPVVIDGVEHYVEQSVAWLSEDEADTAATSDLGMLLFPEVEEHRAQVQALLRRGASSSELAEAQQRAAERYGKAIRTAVRKERSRQAAETYEVAQDQTARAPDRVYTLSKTPAMRASEALLARTVQQARAAAVTMASRVQTELVRQLGADVPSRITMTGLAREASGAVRAAGQAQVIESAYQVAPPGASVIAWIRLGFLDGRICDWCKSQHRRRWVMSTELEEFTEYVDRHGPPDNDCEGTADRCRCRLVPVYGRVE
jgi:hypothetical protein